MERLKERIVLAGQALQRLHELALRVDLTEVERDALIQRFEFSFEIVWKVAKDYLSVEEGIDAASPKKVIRSCREVGLLDEAETRLALVMADDRNLTAHTYDEEFAQQMVTKIVEYDLLLRCWYEKMIK
jgi:nucleotidyltransferase substrate binding protein (TIGR01987 family)